MVRYAVVAALFVAGVIAVLWPWLGPDGRRGLILAGALAYPVQLAGFGLLMRYRRRMKAFLAVWAGGTVLRLGLVLATGVLLFRVTWLAPMPTLLSLAGLFFGLLLLEPLFFDGARASLAEES